MLLFKYVLRGRSAATVNGRTCVIAGDAGEKEEEEEEERRHTYTDP